MIRLREDGCQSRYCANGIAAWVLAVIALFGPLGKSAEGQPAQGQSPGQVDSATLQGFVRDSHGLPVAGVAVYLRAETGTQTLVARTNAEGIYRFAGIHQGVYTLRAEMSGYGEASVGPCVLGPKETKSIDLSLKTATGSAAQTGSPKTAAAEKPQFFDEPEFTVAGVTEAMNPGGHGSDTILRTTETLAKETASLGVTPLNGESTDSSSSSSKTAVEESLRKTAEREPGNSDANRRLGKLLLEAGKAREALPYLDRASKLNPNDYDIAGELARAHADTGQYELARAEVGTLLARPGKSEQQQAELHHLLGEVEEKLGNPLEAVREYQKAAELNPSEADLFDWGSDLLMHRAYEPAIEVFTKGNRLYPRSVRMLAGVGAAWYARGSYDLAADRLCQASDLDPEDPIPYLFLGKMQSVRTTQSECLVERLRRFAGMQPGNALANYYYALSLWNRHESLGSVEDFALVESLLEKAVHLDSKFGAAYLQLGIFYSERGDSGKAIAAYQKATEVNPGLEEAHYRLGEAYGRAGDKSKAQAELQLYEQLSKKTAEEAGRERHDIQQFVFTLRDSNSASQPR